MTPRPEFTKKWGCGCVIAVDEQGDQITDVNGRPIFVRRCDGNDLPNVFVEIEVAKETPLQEAQRLVYGDRGAAYGHPLDDYTKTAALWSVILGTKVTPQQAILCMIAVKISRQMNKHKRDNIVDIAGYAECLNRVEDEVKRRQEAIRE
jgi:hypothetical protein